MQHHSTIQKISPKTRSFTLSSSFLVPSFFLITTKNEGRTEKHGKNRVRQNDARGRATKQKNPAQGGVDKRYCYAITG